MSDTKLIQAVLDKVSSIDKRVFTLDKKVDDGFKHTNRRIDEVEKKLTERIDKVGLHLARLEDDSPTIEEFDKVDKRVSKLENQAPKN